MLKGKKTITSDSNDEIVEGTLELTGNVGAAQMLTGYSGYSNNPKSKISGSMPNRGAVSQKLSINGSYTIPAGYHNGSGKVTQSIPTQGGKTVTPTASTQTVVSAGRYVTGDIKVAGVSGLPDAKPNKTIERKNTEIKEISVPFMTTGLVDDIVGTNYSAVLLRVKIKLNTSNAYKDLGLVYFDKFKIDNDINIILKIKFKDSEITTVGATSGYLNIHVSGVPNTTGVRFWSYLYIDKSYQEFNATSYDLQITLEGAWK